MPREAEIWTVVLLAGLGGQAAKLLVYSATLRRLRLAVLGQSAGLPSLHAVVGSSLVASLALRTGWSSPETSVALVLLVITVFDAMRVRGAAQEQRRLTRELVLGSIHAGLLQRRVASYLDLIAHAPAHVAVGLVWGGLFAVAFAARAR